MADTFEADLRNLIIGDSTVSALIGAGDAARCYWSETPQAKQRPLISLWNIVRPEDRVMSGPNGLYQGFVQIDAWGSTALESITLGNAVAGALKGFAGVQGGTNFRVIYCEVEADSNEPVGGQPAQRYYRRRLSAEAWFKSA